MPDYRTCVCGESGAVMRSFSFSAIDDTQAVEKSATIEGARVEIWQGDRLVKRLEQSLAVQHFPRRRY